MAIALSCCTGQEAADAPASPVAPSSPASAVLGSVRIVKFSGFRWLVKNGQRVGPGPNYFSDSELNVAVAADGLHLRIDRRDGRWYTAEVIADRSLGYGVYTFRLVSRVDVLDSQAVVRGIPVRERQP